MLISIPLAILCICLEILMVQRLENRWVTTHCPVIARAFNDLIIRDGPILGSVRWTLSFGCASVSELSNALNESDRDPSPPRQIKMDDPELAHASGGVWGLDGPSGWGCGRKAAAYWGESQPRQTSAFLWSDREPLKLFP